MGCEETKDLLPMYVGGDLPRDVADSVGAHVARCAECGRELDVYREARAGLAALKEGEKLPGSEWKAMADDVHRRLFPRMPSRWLPMFDEALRYAAVLMVGLALGVGAYMAQRRPAPPQAPTIVNFAGTGDPRSTWPGAVPAGAAPFRPPTFDLRRPAPPPGPEAGYHLPKVEAIPEVADRDF